VQVRSGQEVENAEIVRFARLFNDELTLDNLERLQVGTGQGSLRALLCSSSWSLFRSLTANFSRNLIICNEPWHGSSCFLLSMKH
jgi:hypothetical protein